MENCYPSLKRESIARVSEILRDNSESGRFVVVDVRMSGALGGLHSVWFVAQASTAVGETSEMRGEAKVWVLAPVEVEKVVGVVLKGSDFFGFPLRKNARVLLSVTFVDDKNKSENGVVNERVRVKNKSENESEY